MVTAVVMLAACGRTAALVPAPPTSTSSATSSVPPVLSTTIAPPTIAPPTTTTAAADPQRTLDDLRDAVGASGAMAAVEIDGVTRQWQSGSADGRSTPIDAATRFRIASLTKPLVAAVTMHARADHLLSLDDRVASLDPGPLPADDPVTVRMLLNHTSGLFDEMSDGDPEADVDRITDPGLRDEGRALVDQERAGATIVFPDRLLVALSETHPRYFAAGTGFHYSRTDFQLLGMVLQHATGRPLAELLRAQIITPLRLQHTSLAPDDRSSPELHGYGPDPSADSRARHEVPRTIDLTDDLRLFGNGASGGVVSTPSEVLAMYRAIVGGTLVTLRQVSEMEVASPESNGLYGLGIETYHLPCGVYYGHEGGVAGTASIAVMSADARRGAVVVVNRRGSGDAHLPAVVASLVCGS